MTMNNNRSASSTVILTLPGTMVCGPGTQRPCQRLVVRALSWRATRGHLCLGPDRVPCALGRGGIKAMKREGDGASPRGRFQLRALLYRPDRGMRPVSGLPCKPIRLHDGWSDDVRDRSYNRPVVHPYPTSAEQLWRHDGLYDLIIVLDHNERPRVRGHGSAVFMHIARPDMAPTAGCVALRARDLARLVARLRLPASLDIGM